MWDDLCGVRRKCTFRRSLAHSSWCSPTRYPPLSSNVEWPGDALLSNWTIMRRISALNLAKPSQSVVHQKYDYYSKCTGPFSRGQYFTYRYQWDQQARTFRTRDTSVVVFYPFLPFLPCFRIQQLDQLEQADKSDVHEAMTRKSRRVQMNGDCTTARPQQMH